MNSLLWFCSHYNNSLCNFTCENLKLIKHLHNPSNTHSGMLNSARYKYV